LVEALDDGPVSNAIGIFNRIQALDEGLIARIVSGLGHVESLVYEIESRIHEVQSLVDGVQARADFAQLRGQEILHHLTDFLDCSHGLAPLVWFVSQK
jgi:hypothetical protein